MAANSTNRADWKFELQDCSTSLSRQIKNPRLKAVLLAFLFLLLPFSGCHSRIETPELEYSDSDVELIRKEIDGMEW